MADDNDYTEGGVTLNQECDDWFAEEAIQRVLSFGIPYKIYRDAFISADGDRCGEECANILSALISAAVWGASNSEWVIAVADGEARHDAEDSLDDDLDDQGVVH